MYSILATVYKATIGLLVNKGADIEAANLEEGDVTDHEFRSFVVQEIEQAKSEMVEEEDLRTSISYFREGLVHFFKELNKAQTGDKAAFEVPCVERTASATATSEISMISNYEDSIPLTSKSVSSDEIPWASLQIDPRPTFKEPVTSTDEVFQLLSIESSPSSDPLTSAKEALPRKRIPKKLVSTEELSNPFKVKEPRPISKGLRISTDESFREMGYVEGRPSLPTSEGTGLKNLNPAELDNSKREFKKAYLKATEAFNNEDLNLSGRIQAMTIRVAATILEKIEYPEDALAPCMLYLEELHSMTAVQVSFAREFMIGIKGRIPFPKKRSKETISSRKLFVQGIDEHRISSAVCRLNRVIYDVMQTVGKVSLLMTWPCVTTKRIGVEEKVDPLRDSRVTNALLELRMQHCCVAPWSFGQEGEEEHKIKDPRGLVTNTEGEFIVADHEDRNVKVFDRSGKFKYSFCPPSVDENTTELDIRDVAIDMNDCLYVLVRLRNSAGVKATVVCVFEKSGRRHNFFLRKGFCGRNLTVDNNKIMVTSSSQKVEVYEPQNGQFIRSFGEGTLKNAFAITPASDGRVMVSNKSHSDTQVFSEQGSPVFDFTVHGSYNSHNRYPKIAFHQASEHLVVGGFEKKKTRLDILIYTKKGQFVRKIQYREGRIIYISGIAVTVEGRFAAAVRQVDSEGQLHSKVLVV